MTNEELRQKYRLMQVAAEHGVRSYHALDGAGHVCMVHYLPAAAPETAELLALLSALPREQTRIIERVEVDGTPVVVTELIPGFKSFAAWLQTKSARADAGPPASPASRRVGEFTQLFGPSSGEAASPAPDQPRAPTPPRAPPASAAPAPAAGGFTQLFGPQGTPAASSSTPAEPRPPAPPARPASPAPASGGLTQLFGPTGGTEPAPPGEQSPEPSPAPPARGEPPAQPARGAGPRPGEFTQLFGAGGAEQSGPPGPQADTVPALPVDRPPDPPDPDKPNVRWRERPASPERPVVRWKKEGVDDQPPPRRAAPPPPLAPPPASRVPGPPGRPPDASRPKAAGELTQLFGAAGAGTNDPPPPSPERSRPPVDPWIPRSGPSPFGPPSPGGGAASPPPGITPGEFTRLFEPERGLGVPSANVPDPGPPAFFQTPSAPLAPASAPPPMPPTYAAPTPPAPAGPPGEFTRLMGVGGGGGVPGAGAPGDFTRMVAAVPLAPVAQASAMPPALPGAETTRRSPRLVVLLIALGLVGIAAVALVLYLALR